MPSLTSISRYILLLFISIHKAITDPPTKLRWIAAQDLDQAMHEPAGYEPSKDKLNWVGRALFNGGLMVGHYTGTELRFALNDNQQLIQTPSAPPPPQTNPKLKRSTLGMGRLVGVQVAPGGVQVLVYPPGTVSWQPKKIGDGKIPVNMILGGVYPGTKEHVFICRGTTKEHGVIVGHYRLREDNCVVSADEKPVVLQEFQVMSLNFYGMGSGAGAN